MKSSIKKITKSFLMKCPWAGILGLKLARPFRFQAERKAYHGKDSGDGNGRPSIVFFTHYRCASMMVMKRLSDLLAGLDYQVVNYQGYVHPWPIQYREQFQEDVVKHRELKRFNPKGRFFAPLRYYVDIPELTSLKSVVVLRDPRDVLVSRYYSERFAHVRLDSRFLKHCESISDLSIDEFVLNFAEDVGAHYRLYMAHRKELENALFVSYEEVIADFHGFLTQVSQYLDLDKTDVEIAAISVKESFTVGSEDKFAHKRNVKARNFEEKLQPDTISQLDKVLSDILDFFGWENDRALLIDNPFAERKSSTSHE